MAMAFYVLVHPEFVESFGLKPGHATFAQAIISPFLHQNVFHLLGNMIFLAAVGAAVELTGSAGRLLLTYVIGAAAGELTHVLLASRSVDPPILVGASGAIAGCIGAYTMRYLRLKVPVAPKFGASVLAVTLVWVGLQVIGAVVTIGEQVAVSYWAHLGGFFAGLMLSLMVRPPQMAELNLKHQVLAKMNERSPAAALAAAKKHVQEHPDDPNGLRALAEAETRMGHADEAKKAWLKLATLPGITPRPEDIAELLRTGGVSSLPEVRRLQWAESFSEDHQDLSESLLNSIVADPLSPRRADALLELVKLYHEKHTDKFEAYCSILVKDYPMHAATEWLRSKGWAQ
jgi:membrane associated rhomboid family serine protease